MYDYESAVQLSTVMNNNKSSLLLRQSNVGELENDHHHATLDGLCHPAIVKLSALIREEELK